MWFPFRAVGWKVPDIICGFRDTVRVQLQATTGALRITNALLGVSLLFFPRIGWPQTLFWLFKAPMLNHRLVQPPQAEDVSAYRPATFNSDPVILSERRTSC